MPKIVLLGEGAWGTAIAQLLASNGHEVTLWCYHADVADEINNYHTNTKFMPGFPLSRSIQAAVDLSVVQDADLIFEAIPVQYLRGLLEQTKQYVHNKQAWVCLSKGIEQTTLLLPTQLMHNVLGVQSLAVVSGPSFAKELMEQQATAVDCAATDHKLQRTVIDLLQNNFFNVCASNDLLGIQYAGALKNVIALALGIADGADYGANTKAMLITKGLAEIAQVVQAVGGQMASVYGLAGLGDLVLTATSSQSKNFKVGQLLGQGQSLQAVLESTGYIPEGINTLHSLQALAHNYDVQLPLSIGVACVLQGKQNFKSVLATLFSCFTSKMKKF